MSDSVLKACIARVESSPLFGWRGKVTRARGSLVESEGPLGSVGEMCEIAESTGKTIPCEIVGFRESHVLSMPLEAPRGVRYGDAVTSRGCRPVIRVSDDLLGRVVDGLGSPIDQTGPVRASETRPLEAAAPLPLERVPIAEPLGCGIRAIDAFVTCGRGQRIGIFGGSGVGKSTLIGMMARNTSADLTVLGLVGERGREVRDFLENSLGTEGRKRACVVVSTSDQSPLLRIRAALAATAIAEYFCGKGRHVLLVVDSLTRMAMAQREIGLAAGEPPTAKGYTPSCFDMLARLIERAGRFSYGSITAFYTVLMEGDDEQDPLVDGARALLDGHIMLDRKLAVRSHFPPIAVLHSVSRLMSSIVSAAHLQKVQNLRRLAAAYAASEDLVRIGAYQKGTDATLDKALALAGELDQFLIQKPTETAPFAETVNKLLSLPG